jgi:hypothetical protein
MCAHTIYLFPLRLYFLFASATMARSSSKSGRAIFSCASEQWFGRPEPESAQPDEEPSSLFDRLTYVWKPLP